MKKLLLLLALFLSMSGLLISCGNSSPTSSNSNPTATPTTTATPQIAITYNLVNFTSAVNLKGLCVDSSNNVYVANYNTGGTGSYLVKVTSAGVTTQLAQIDSVTDVAYDGTNWYATTGSTSPYFTYYNGSVTALGLPSTPTAALSGVAVNSGGTTLALSSGSAVSFFSLPGFSYIANFTLPAASVGPQAMAFDKNGSLYVSLGNVVVKYSVGVSGATTIAGQTSTGFADGAATTTAKFSSIDAVAVDGSGNVYVADAGSNNAIREISGGTVTTLLGGPSSSFTLTDPQGVAVDGSGNLYITDSSTPKIYKYTP